MGRPVVYHNEVTMLKDLVSTFLMNYKTYIETTEAKK